MVQLDVTVLGLCGNAQSRGVGQADAAVPGGSGKGLGEQVVHFHFAVVGRGVQVIQTAAGNGNVAVGGGQGVGLRRHILDGDIAVAGIHREACKRPAGQLDGDGADALAVVHAHGSVALEALNVQARARNGKAVQLSARAKGIVVGAVVAVLHHHMVHIIGFYRHIGVFVADG